MLLSILEERARIRENVASEGVVLVHMVVNNTSKPFASKPNGYTMIGDLVHIAARILMGDPPAACRVVEVGRVEPHPSRARYLRAGSVIICGHADFLYNGVPVELKTTRRDRKAPELKWVLQAELYAWLYGVPRAYVDVINIVSGTEHVWECPALEDDEVAAILRAWLRREPVLQHVKRCKSVFADHVAPLCPSS